MKIYFSCPKCGNNSEAPFQNKCSFCGFNIDHLIGIRLSNHQQKKYEKHTSLLRGEGIALDDGEYNASFDHNGDANLVDLINFTISYGDRGQIPDSRGIYSNEAIVAYVPEIVGSGTSIYDRNCVPCSGICIISPQSYEYGHSFPTLDDWVTNNFSGKSSCRYCGNQTDFGQPFCADCYNKCNIDWRQML